MKTICKRLASTNECKLLISFDYSQMMKIKWQHAHFTLRMVSVRFLLMTMGIISIIDYVWSWVKCSWEAQRELVYLIYKVATMPWWPEQDSCLISGHQTPWPAPPCHYSLSLLAASTGNYSLHSLLCCADLSFQCFPTKKHVQAM